MKNLFNAKNQTPWRLVRKRTISTEQLPLVFEFIANFST
jgi:hypothetical protein